MIRTREKAIFWIVGISLFLIFLSLISDILLPFIVGILAAYFLDPAADKLEEWGSSRIVATSLLTVAFFTIVIVVCMILIPVLYEQFSALVTKLPIYVSQLQERYGEVIKKLLSIVENKSTGEKATEAIGSVSGYIIKFSGDIIANILHSGMALLNLLSLIFISPVVSFYLLRDWDKITAKIDSWLPRDHAPVIREQLKLIDKTLSGYIRGQTNVCLLLGIFYATGLMLVGLDFGLFVGLATGLFAFIPYVGLLLGLSTGLGIAFFQFGGDISQISIVLLVFVIGQMIEGNFITPKLVGDKVGLHPVWIIFGLLAGGSMFGFAGILIAVPVTAIIGVLSRFALAEYMKGSLYAGSKKRTTTKRLITKKKTTK